MNGMITAGMNFSMIGMFDGSFWFQWCILISHRHSVILKVCWDIAHNSIADMSNDAINGDAEYDLPIRRQRIPIKLWSQNTRQHLSFRVIIPINADVMKHKHCPNCLVYHLNILVFFHAFQGQKTTFEESICMLWCNMNWGEKNIELLHARYVQRWCSRKWCLIKGLQDMRRWWITYMCEWDINFSSPFSKS